MAKILAFYKEIIPEEKKCTFKDNKTGRVFPGSPQNTHISHLQ